MGAQRSHTARKRQIQNSDPALSLNISAMKEIMGNMATTLGIRPVHHQMVTQFTLWTLVSGGLIPAPNVTTQR